MPTKKFGVNHPGAEAVGAFLLFIAALMILTLFGFSSNGGGNKATRIELHNPYYFGVRAEVKCDWNKKSRYYGFYKKILVPGRGKYVLEVPKTCSKCEVWPKVVW